MEKSAMRDSGPWCSRIEATSKLSGKEGWAYKPADAASRTQAACLMRSKTHRVTGACIRFGYCRFQEVVAEAVGESASEAPVDYCGDTRLRSAHITYRPIATRCSRKSSLAFSPVPRR